MAAQRLWLGAFTFCEYDPRDGTGSEGAFQIITRARGPAHAIRLFRQRLRHIRTTSDLFDRPCRFYLDALIDLAPESFSTPALVNFSTTEDDTEITFWSSVPDQADTHVRVYEPGPKAQLGRPFLYFRHAHHP